VDELISSRASSAPQPGGTPANGVTATGQVSGVSPLPEGPVPIGSLVFADELPDGVVVAERGRQPRVAPPPEIQQPMGALYSLFASVEAAGLAQHSIVRRFDTRADAVVADRLCLDASTPLVYLERLRLAGDEPLALDRVWLPAALAAPLLGADFTHTSLYAELATPRKTWVCWCKPKPVVKELGIAA